MQYGLMTHDTASYLNTTMIRLVFTLKQILAPTNVSTQTKLQGTVNWFARNLTRCSKGTQSIIVLEYRLVSLIKSSLSLRDERLNFNVFPISLCTSNI